VAVRAADNAQIAGATAIARILKLDDDSIWVGEIKLRRSFLCFPRIFPTYSHPRLERAASGWKIRIKGIEFCYAMRGLSLPYDRAAAAPALKRRVLKHVHE